MYTIYNNEKQEATTENDLQKVKYSPNPYGDYQCFHYDFTNLKSVIDKESADPVKCKSLNPKYNTVGVWDTKCVEDTDCAMDSKCENNKCVEDVRSWDEINE